MTQFEIEKTHTVDGEVERCQVEFCSLDHQWSVYQRDLDKRGESLAEWQSDHVSVDRAEQAAYIYALMATRPNPELVN